MQEADAPGVSGYRAQLSELLKNYAVNVRPHEQVISALDQAGKTLRGLIIKTNMTIPYTSDFLELGCRYWSADAESRLRIVKAHHRVRHREMVEIPDKKVPK